MTPQDRDRILALDPWYRSLPAPLAQAMLARMVTRSLRPGELLFAQGDPPEGLCAILTGRIRVSSVSAGGQAALLTILEPGAWFGEISLLDGLPRTHDNHAIGDTTLLLLRRRDFNHLTTELPALYRHIVRLTCQRMRASFVAIEDATLLGLPARLAKRLLNLAEIYGGIRLSHEELAQMLGAARPTISRELKRWEQAGWIKLDYGRLSLIDPAALARIAQP